MIPSDAKLDGFLMIFGRNFLDFAYWPRGLLPLTKVSQTYCFPAVHEGLPKTWILPVP